jgi:hypothetical protein
MKINDKNKIISYILAVLMLLSLLNSAYFFLSVAGFGLTDWLSFNACSLSIIVYLICFVCYQFKKEGFYLAIALVPLYYYGTMGLFVMPWNTENLFAQLTHVVITLNVIWILVLLLRKSDYESLGKGLLVGVLLFVPVFAVIQTYLQLHSNEFLQLLQKVH